MDRYLVAAGESVDLAARDANDKGDFKGGKREGRQRLTVLSLELRRLQEMLYAGQPKAVLIVLQGMDTAGKDGAIRHVFGALNPQGVRVASFKKPSTEEQAHDYLWRVHQKAPRQGELVIFNRSHYEDVLVVRVHGLQPEEVWRKRYEQINAFERMLVAEGTLILKFFLHITADEQKERLQARLDRPDKLWKFNPGDLAERKLWPHYTAAYQEALNKTSTEWAPWRIVPANRKWYRDLVVGETTAAALRGLKMSFPAVDFDPQAITIA